MNNPVLLSSRSVLFSYQAYRIFNTKLHRFIVNHHWGLWRSLSHLKTFRCLCDDPRLAFLDRQYQSWQAKSFPAQRIRLPRGPAFHKGLTVLAVVRISFPHAVQSSPVDSWEKLASLSHLGDCRMSDNTILGTRVLTKQSQIIIDLGLIRNDEYQSLQHFRKKLRRVLSHPAIDQFQLFVKWRYGFSVHSSVLSQTHAGLGWGMKLGAACYLPGL